MPLNDSPRDNTAMENTMYPTEVIVEDDLVLFSVLVVAAYKCLLVR